MTVIRNFGAPPTVDREITLSQSSRHWLVPEETPVAFVYNGRNYAVMMATPADFADFAVGFSLTERVIDSANDLEALDIHQEERGVELRMTIDRRLSERLDLRQQRRNLVGRTGCGVCGLENAETIFEALPKVAPFRLKVPERSLLRAIEGLSSHQPLNARTRTVHAAAWATLAGEVVLAREDVGRHNALDKLLGGLAREARQDEDGFVVMSSRCSYEIVEKAARLGIRAVLSISAPTAFAIRKAAEANIALYVRAGEGVVEIGA